MKNLSRNILLSLLALAASGAYGASLPAMDVTVSNPSGKLVYKGKVAANGTFSTGKLEPGNYVVEFNSKTPGPKGAQYAVVVSAGKKKVSADAVPGEKFAAGGVAMKVDVGPGLNLTGQVAAGAITAPGQSNARVKIVNGKRYVWVGPETGSNMGGRWVEEGEANVPGLNLQHAGAQGLQNMQDRGSQGSIPGG